MCRIAAPDAAWPCAGRQLHPLYGKLVDSPSAKTLASVGCVAAGLARRWARGDTVFARARPRCARMAQDSIVSTSSAIDVRLNA